MTKRCIRCGETKSIDAFGKKADMKDGLNCYCRACRFSARSEYKRKGITKRVNPDERFSASFVPVTESGCWLWDGRIDAQGYGVMAIGKKTYGAHRYSWTKYRGEIPDGLGVLHKCDVRNCINPDHLFLGTQIDNMDDMGKKGRSGKRKLTAAAVLEIRGRYPAESFYKIAKTYGVYPFTIQRIIEGSTWKHVQNEEGLR